MGREGGPSDRLGTNRHGGLPCAEPPATRPARCLGIGPRLVGFRRGPPVNPTGRPYGLAADRGCRRGAARLSRAFLRRPLAVPDQRLVLSLALLWTGQLGRERDDSSSIRRPDRSEAEWRGLISTTCRNSYLEGPSTTPRCSPLRSGRRSASSQ